MTFAYPDSPVNVLECFSHDFHPGSRTAIVGPTGVGKSTIIRLLLSLLKPQSGYINVYNDCAEEIVKAFADFAAKDEGRCSTMKASIIGKVVASSGKAETQEEQVLFED